MTIRALRIAALLMLAMPFLARGSFAGDLLPPISTTHVYRADVVEAAKGNSMTGSIEFAYRDGDIVHYFTSDANCAIYAADPAKFRDTAPAVKLAFMGADPVIRFPNGVHSRDLGALINGDPARMVLYKNAEYAFAYEATARAFRADPAKYVPEVGGYCLGAMSAGHITPGDPRNVYFVAEEQNGGMWAVFGSPEGPGRWAAMTTTERREKLAIAKSNYDRFVREGLSDKVASR